MGPSEDGKGIDPNLALVLITEVAILLLLGIFNTHLMLKSPLYVPKHVAVVDSIYKTRPPLGGATLHIKHLSELLAVCRLAGGSDSLTP